MPAPTGKHFPACNACSRHSVNFNTRTMFYDIVFINLSSFVWPLHHAIDPLFINFQSTLAIQTLSKRLLYKCSNKKLVLFGDTLFVDYSSAGWIWFSLRPMLLSSLYRVAIAVRPLHCVRLREKSKLVMEKNACRVQWKQLWSAMKTAKLQPVLISVDWDLWIGLR